MNVRAYYNEFDPVAAEWLRSLISAGEIPSGEVDTRSIVDVRADDLRGFTQCHFFAGIGGWSYALRLAGWPDDRPVWTGSCPCQPFSVAGKRKGTDDERHLWPEFRRLISECNPATVFGEQVASRDGRLWLDTVRLDLEALGYAVGAADLCAAGVGAPHIRQRLYWLADATVEGRITRGRSGSASDGGDAARVEFGRLCDAGGLGDAIVPRLEGYAGNVDNGHEPGRIGAHAAGPTAEAGDTRGLADADGGDAGSERKQCGGEQRQQPQDGFACVGSERPSPLHGFWRDADWLGCRDGRWRPVEPGLEPLAHGISGRVGRLRGYGNAIVPQVAAAFIKAARDVIG